MLHHPASPALFYVFVEILLSGLLALFAANSRAVHLSEIAREPAVSIQRAAR